MKIRQGFVSNSSSSSFIVLKENLNNWQLKQLYEHMSVGKTLGVYIPYRPIDKPFTDDDRMYEGMDAWSINEEVKDDGNTYITGYTSMNNFPMEDFLKKIGVKGVLWDY